MIPPLPPLPTLPATTKLQLKLYYRNLQKNMASADHNNILK